LVKYRKKYDYVIHGQTPSEKYALQKSFSKEVSLLAKIYPVHKILLTA